MHGDQFQAFKFRARSVGGLQRGKNLLPNPNRLIATEIYTAATRQQIETLGASLFSFNLVIIRISLIIFFFRL
jgi:hypothetical protein